MGTQAPVLCHVESLCGVSILSFPERVLLNPKVTQGHAGLVLCELLAL